MRSKEKSKILSLALFIFVLSASFFLYLGLSVNSVHNSLLVLGLSFILMGAVFWLFNRLFKNREFSERFFVYIPLSCLVLIFVLSVCSVLFPKIILASLLFISMIWSYCICVFMSFWKRSGGIVPVLLSLVGIGVSGVYASLHRVDLVDVVMFVKVSLLSLLLVLILRRPFKVIPALICVLFILLPLDTESLYKRTSIDGYERLGSHVTRSRKVEVHISRNDPREHILFLENGRKAFSFPFSYEQELSLCFALLQNKAPGNILVAGDAPLGFFSVIKKMPRIGVVHYLPSDPSYERIWENYASSEVLKTFVVIPSKDKLMDRYGMIIFFPPTVRGYGSKAGLSRALFRLLSGKLSTTGTFTIVLSKELDTKELSSDLEVRLQNILYAIYGSVYSSQLNGFKFIFASKDADNISSDPSTLKYRYLMLGVEYEYIKAKQFFESTGSRIIRTVPKELPSHYLVAGLIVLAVSLVLFALFMTNSTWHRLDTVIYTFVIGAGFGLSMLIDQMFRIDSYSVFMSSFGLLVLSSTLSMILSSWKRLDGLGHNWKIIIASVFGALIILSVITMGSISLYPLLIGASFGLVVLFNSWDRSNCDLSITSINRIIYLYLIGVGVGLLGLFVLTKYSFSLSEISLVLACIFVLVLIYNVLVLRRSR